MKRTLLLLITSILLIPSVVISQQFKNPGFEAWEDVGLPVKEPNNWSSIKTSDNPSLNAIAPFVWERSTDAHSGNYSVRLINMLAFPNPPIIATGTMTNGRVHPTLNPDSSYIYTDTSDTAWYTSFTFRPDSLVGWYKYFPNGDDFGAARAILHTGAGQIPPHNNDSSRIIGYAVFDMPAETVNTWTRFSVPFKYRQSGNPEYILLTFYAGNGTTPKDSSYAFFDDFLLIYGSSGINDHTVDRNYLYYSNGKITIHLNSDDDFLGHLFQVTDLTGRVVYSTRLTSRVITDLPAVMPEGIYIAILDGKDEFHAQKFYLKH